MMAIAITISGAQAPAVCCNRRVHCLAGAQLLRAYFQGFEAGMLHQYVEGIMECSC